ncbi:MAG: hypothetical protein K6E49_07695 [Lachnospiraceae bacterium]|nr:hypothetical protein [Lachnospiraceae bacterium]
MLGKLLKHDFIATWKVMVCIDVLLVVLGVLTALVIRTIPHVDDSFGMSMFMFSFVGVFYIGIIAANIVSLIYLVMRYYKNLYTSEGYLTFTLPVKTDMIIHSKVITGSVWMFLSYLFTLISILIAGAGFFSTVDVSREKLHEAMMEMFDFLGFGDPVFVATLLFTILITPVAAVVCMYFCVSIGQLWQNHKVLGSVLCIIGLYMFNQVVSQLVFIVSGFWNIMSQTGADIDASFALLYRNILLLLSIVTFIQAVIFYVVCIIIARKKINLD